MNWLTKPFFVVFASASCLLCIAPSGAFAAKEEPPIGISSIEELQRIGREEGYPFNGSYYLTQDIDASETSAWEDGAGFAPIMPFAGFFDGAGRVISGLHINRPEENNAGLFSQLATVGEIRNLAIVDSAIIGGNNSGVFVGFSVGVISQCYTTASLTGEIYAGGIAGVNGGSIMRCFFAGEIVDGQIAGGIVGLLDGLIQECYAAGPINGEFFSGGLAGYSVPDDPLKRKAASEVLASFWDTEVCGTGMSPAGGTGLGTAAMMQAASFTAEGWNFESIWNIEETRTYPWLRILPNPYEGAPFHSGDQNQNNMISLSELLRVIQFYNSGGLHCAIPPDSTEDGYVPGVNPAQQACAPHASDYNPQNWIISLSELLRLIQFYNSGGYYACPDAEPPAEDGFCISAP